MYGNFSGRNSTTAILHEAFENGNRLAALFERLDVVPEWVIEQLVKYGYDDELEHAVGLRDSSQSLQRLAEIVAVASRDSKSWLELGGRS